MRISVPIIIMGDSGTGKTTSIRTFNEGEVEVINVGAVERQGSDGPVFEFYAVERNELGNTLEVVH